MLGLRKRHAGVRLPSAKTVADVALTEIPAPQNVYIPLQQHIGIAAEPCVKRGDRVLMGDPLSMSDHPMQVPVHASVSGKVRSITEGVLPSGRLGTIVHIENDGLYERRETSGRPSPHDYTPEEIRKAVHEGGVVGLGGAAFPTSVKLNPKKKIDTLLINGCEGEPVLSADHRAILELTDLMLYGIQAMQIATGAERVIIALEDHDPDGAEHLRKEAKGIAEVVVVPAVYPVSSEYTLIKAVLGRRIPIGGLPADVGVVVQNVETAVAVGRVLRDGWPLTRRIITVAGGDVERPGNYYVALGTTIADVLEHVGCPTPRQVLLGGPMMGQAVPNLDIPVVKGTSGIMALSPAEIDVREPLPCVRCGQCIAVCDKGLSPMMLLKYIQNGEWEKAEEWGLRTCMECGACAFVCPSNIPLVQWFKSGKATLSAKAAPNSKGS